MPTVEIRNIGPVREGGVMNFAPFTALFGPQSSGKSTILKVLSFCTWLEKQVMLPETDAGKVVYDYTHYNHFRSRLAQFHRFDDKEFTADSYIRYSGECVEITMEGRKNASIKLHPDFREKRHNSKISFIPAERNIVPAIRNYDRLVRSRDIDGLINYILEWQEARENFKSKNPLMLSADNEIKYYFDEARKGEYFRFRQNGKESSLPLFYASSGIQASAPVDVLTRYFASQVRQEIPLTAAMLRSLDKPSPEIPDPEKLRQYQSVNFFIEEPEQNLFPASQSAMTANLIGLIHNLNTTPEATTASRVAVTTHSPYVLNRLNLAIKGREALNKNRQRALRIIAEPQTISYNDVSAYFIDNGRLVSLLDEEMKMISGVDLDSASATELETDYALDSILYE